MENSLEWGFSERMYVLVAEPKSGSIPDLFTIWFDNTFHMCYAIHIATKYGGIAKLVKAPCS